MPASAFACLPMPHHHGANRHHRPRSTGRIRASGAFAAHRGDTGARRHGMSVLPSGDDGNRGRHLRAAGCDPGAISGHRDAASETRLPGLCRPRGADTRAGAADRGRHPDRSLGRPCAGRALCRSPAAVSPGADHGTAGRDPRALDLVALDGRSWPKVPSAKPLERPAEGMRRRSLRPWLSGCESSC